MLVVGPQRQHPRPRHRGLLQHRRPGVQGHAARRGREVRGRRQGDRQEGPRRDRPLLRQRLRGPDRLGANDAQTIKALLEAEAWPGPSLVIAYCTCIAHGIDMSHVDEPPEGRRQERLLAALPVPAERGRGRHAVQARLAPRRRSRSPTSWPPRPGSRSSRGRDPERAADAGRAAPRPTPTSAGATTSSSPASSARVPARSRARRSTPRQRTVDGRSTRDRRPAHPLPRARPALADRRLGRRRCNGELAHGPAPRGRRRGGDRPAVAVRGGDRPRGDRARPARSRRGRSSSPRRSTTSRPSTRSPTRQRPLRRRLIASSRRGVASR